MKIFFSNKFYLLLALFSGVALTSCLKDDGFEEGRYQTVNSNTEGQEWISIPVAGRPNKIFAVGVTSLPIAQTIELFPLSYDYVNPASQDITVTLTVNNNLLTTANAALAADNKPTLVTLPSTAYTLPSTTITIPSGKRISDPFTISLKADGLDPTKLYGVGLTISSVSKSGVSIPANLKDVVVAFSIKNKYDGRYRLKGYHNRVPYNFPYDVEMHMITSGPNEVYFYWPEVKSQGHPIGIGPGGTSWYGTAISPAVVFNTTTDLVTNVYNLSSAVPITMFTGPGAGVSRFEDDPDPTKRKMYVYFNYSGNPERAFFDTLTYIGPRP